MNRDKLFDVTGFKFIIDELDVRTGYGKKKLKGITFIKEHELIERELEELSMFIEHFSNENSLKELKEKLSTLKDISGTIERLKSAEILDDVDFFELKEFFLNYESLIENIQLPEFLPQIAADELLKVLDPEGLKLKNFHIYSAYSKELAALRKEKRALKHLDASKDNIFDIQERLRRLSIKEMELEQKIRHKLSGTLRDKAQKISAIAELIGKIDFLQAKAGIARKFNLCCPTLSTEVIRYKGLFNPEIKEILESNLREFQPVDLFLKEGVCVITGANMCGKTVLLRTIALAQLMFQAGFFVPASKAEMVPLEGVFFFSGDYQSYKRGLSSFAAEVLELKEAINHAKQRWLILFDELARNTNPDEGKALVSAISEFFSDSRCYTMITTHYGGITGKIRHYRVKGLKEKMPEKLDSPVSLVDYVDYSLIELNDGPGEVPHEALKIAEIFGLDKEIIAKAKKKLLEEE
ncbi:hypothetical protein AT15_08645 [Kosmotoga arenicorallina S304]|uniref:DNA mismatch repair proteins mutS family domain-containing protein n=1 Tax=Kosmotoga arenicorallina S304 TaxID=1453497 RepID=A0A176K1Y7_9BACT|nr:DNA mismatch repair protein MutS [Kosmotoga arenicorallina]OAA31033.1 hypothetical protein AT15_08645 [Kosmotoga arenicorallina S304]